MKQVTIVIIGGGSAGMAAALEAYEQGCRDILILERDCELGGILLQCIHNGFGLHMFGEELAGPSYAERFLERLNETKIQYKTNSIVTHLYADKRVEYVNEREGYVCIQAKTVILAMGCRERTRGAIAIPGERPSGIWTAGTAQRYLNMEGYLVGRRVFILGSGDIGLIMARRMTLEGAKVLGVAELMPYSNGLPRNMKQCLEDFDIPLYLSHTITDIRGRDRISSLVIAQVDASMQPISGTEKTFEVDTLLLSVGLIPENALSTEAGVELHPVTRGAVVDEHYETNVPGIFACGNALHVHDLVDYVSEEAAKAGKYAAEYAQGKLQAGEEYRVEAGTGISYILPQRIVKETVFDKIAFSFRVTKNYRKAGLELYHDGVLMKRIKKPYMVPAQMQTITLTRKELIDIKKELRICVIEDIELFKEESR
ncbi:MAG: FAD-dependent oxidoreductase [Lachnospiraceae bacterium]